MFNTAKSRYKFTPHMIKKYYSAKHTMPASPLCMKISPQIQVQVQAQEPGQYPSMTIPTCSITRSKSQHSRTQVLPLVSSLIRSSPNVEIELNTVSLNTSLSQQIKDNV